MKTLSGFDYSVKQDYSKDRAKKVNFMIKIHILEDLEKLIPAGKRSEFVNEVLEETLMNYGRKKAYELMEKVRNEQKLKMNTKETLKLIKYGRE